MNTTLMQSILVEPSNHTPDEIDDFFYQIQKDMIKEVSKIIDLKSYSTLLNRYRLEESKNL
jgi:hypothetical protein